MHFLPQIINRVILVHSWPWLPNYLILCERFYALIWMHFQLFLWLWLRKWLIQIVYNRLIIFCSLIVYDCLIILISKLICLQLFLLGLVNFIESENFTFQQSAKKNDDLAKSFSGKYKSAAASAHKSDLSFKECFALLNVNFLGF